MCRIIDIYCLSHSDHDERVWNVKAGDILQWQIPWQKPRRDQNGTIYAIPDVYVDERVAPCAGQLYVKFARINDGIGKMMPISMQIKNRYKVLTGNLLDEDE